MVKAALGFLLGRFSGTVLKYGEHIVPEAALEALADQDFVFTVQGKANEKQVAALQNSVRRKMEETAQTNQALDYQL